MSKVSHKEARSALFKLKISANVGYLDMEAHQKLKEYILQQAYKETKHIPALLKEKLDVQD